MGDFKLPFLTSNKVQSTINFGRYLMVKKKTMKHGEWGPFLKRMFGEQHLRSCQNAMRLAQFDAEGKITPEMYKMGSDQILFHIRNQRASKRKIVNKPNEKGEPTMASSMPQSLKMAGWFNALEEGEEFTIPIVIKRLEIATPTAYSVANLIVEIGAAVCENKPGMRCTTYMKICDLPHDFYDMYLEIEAEKKNRKKGRKKKSPAKAKKKSLRVSAKMKETGKLATELNKNPVGEVELPTTEKAEISNPHEPVWHVVMERSEYMKLHNAIKLMGERIKELSEENARLKNRPLPRPINSQSLIDAFVPKDIAKGL